MSKLGRRLVLRGSVGLAAAGTFASPYIARAQAKTATVLWVQGFVKEEDEAFKNLVAAYEKASGNKIDFSLIPFGPAMQKIVAGLTSGDTPDIMFHDIADQAVVPQNTWNDKLLDVSDVVETQKDKFHPTALLASQLLQQRHQAARLHLRADQMRRAAVPRLELDGREGRLQAQRRAQDLGRVLGLLQADAEEAARDPAQRLRSRPAADHQRAGRRQQHLPPLPDRQRRQRHRHAGRPGAPRRSQDQGSGDQVAHLHHDVLQGRLRAAGGAELERRRRQQRLPRQADRDGSRRHHLDRGRDDPREGEVQRRRHDEAAERQRRPADAGRARRGRRLHRQKREERRGRQGLPEVRDPAGPT